MSKLSTAWRLLRTNRPQMLLVLLDKLKLTRKVPDKTFIKLKYHAIFGKPLNLKDPKTFNEKMQWLKLYDRRSEYAVLQDKYRAREYVAAKIGEEHLIPLLGVWERAEDIDFDALPNEFVLKCNHDAYGEAGSVILCRNKGDFDREAAIKKLRACLKPARQYWPYREWVYKDIPPLVMAEKRIKDRLNAGGGAVDYMFHCFGGKCRLVSVTQGNFTGNFTQTFFDRDWQRVPLYRGSANEDYIKRPDSFDEMLRFAEALSENIPYIRIDFREDDGKAYFAETEVFGYSGGFGKFSPDEWGRTLGDWIELPGG